MTSQKEKIREEVKEWILKHPCLCCRLTTEQIFEDILGEIYTGNKFMKDNEICGYLDEIYDRINKLRKKRLEDKDE